MTRADRSSLGLLRRVSDALPCYVVTEAWITVEQKLALHQLRCLEGLLGAPPQRYKAWAERYVFPVPNHRAGEWACLYLRGNHVAHTVELTTRRPPTGGA